MVLLIILGLLSIGMIGYVKLKLQLMKEANTIVNMISLRIYQLMIWNCVFGMVYLVLVFVKIVMWRVETPKTYTNVQALYLYAILIPIDLMIDYLIVFEFVIVCMVIYREKSIELPKLFYVA